MTEPTAPLVETPPVPVELRPVAPRSRWVMPVLLLVLAVLIAASLQMAWSAQNRVRKLSEELARRQQDSAVQSGEARLMAKRAEDTARESAAKVALLEARLAEVAVQRTQLEDLIQSLSRSRDENLLVDIDAGLRAAQQQAIITGSAEPLVSALKQSDERLARYSQPRLEGVRRAIARDVDRVKAVGVADISSLSIKLDEAIRLVDELPLLSQADLRKDVPKPAAAGPKPMGRSASGVATVEKEPGWTAAVTEQWNGALDRLWGETRSLVRVSRIDRPDAMLLAPEQAFFLRENLKLRLLNARLALLSRQFETVQTDLQGAQLSLDRYFDRSSRRTGVVTELVKQVGASARHVSLPRPDDTLAALATATAGR